MAQAPKDPAYRRDVSDPHLPGRAVIDAYGNGGFRFADMSHRGSLLAVPSGVYAWRPAAFDDIASQDLERVRREAGEIEFLLIGTGAHLRQLPEPLRLQLMAAGVRVETMDTGAAARTYNILLGEGRQIAAALIAVE